MREDMFSSSPGIRGASSCDHRSLGHRCTNRQHRGARNLHSMDMHSSQWKYSTCTWDLMDTTNVMTSSKQRMKKPKRPRNMCSGTIATCLQTTTTRATQPQTLGISHFIHHVIPYQSLILFTVLLLHCCQPCTCATPRGSTTNTTTPTAHYPPPFNAAFSKPILLEPAQSTCGYGGKVKKYCKSSIEPSTMTACITQYCDTACAYNNRLPHHEDAFSRVDDGWGNCVSRTSQENPPGNVTAREVVHFKGDLTAGDSCYLTLDQSWMIQIRLKSVWSITVSLWIKPEAVGAVSTILDVADDESQNILRILLDSDLRVQVQSDSYVKGQSSWQLPERQWTHLAVQVQDNWASVFMNGTFVSPALYKIPLHRHNEAEKYRVGQSFAGRDPFIGYMQDMRIYLECISNREIYEVYSGVLPPTRIMPECRCPGANPKLKDTNHVYCVANEGPDRPNMDRYRLKQGASGEAFPVEFINDNGTDTAWLSEPGSLETRISIDLQQDITIHSVEVIFYSPFPNLMLIQREINGTSGWHDWQYFAHDCFQAFGLIQDAEMTSVDDVRCVRMANPDIYSGGTQTFDPLRDRPGQTDGQLSSDLSQFRQATGVRITLRGHHPNVINDDHKYHGVYEVKVNSRCECHGHADSCDRSVTPYVCSCSSDTNTRGRQCEECLPQHFREVPSLLSRPCLSCDCNTNGTEAGDEDCDLNGGQCNCKLNVEGRQCGSCKAGYHSLQASDVEGCQPCQCYLTGTVNSTNQCDPLTANCECKTNVEGDRCNKCAVGFYNMSKSNPEGCQECACHKEGSRVSSTECDPTHGQCQCKRYVTGRSCSSCQTGTYNLTASNPDGCTLCGCDIRGSHNSTCDPQTGQCYCKTHATGRQCQKCAEGYFALDSQDLQTNGCTHPCDCHPDGAADGSRDTCKQYGGQCKCKPHVIGRKCDQCEANTYGFNISSSNGCMDCSCDPVGTVGGSLACNISTGQCSCKKNVVSRRCQQCKVGTFGLDKDDADGCQPCDCYVGGSNPNSICNAQTGKCECMEGAGIPRKTNYKCAPYVDMMVPVYGPESGGTVIHFSGGYLANIQGGNITLGSVQCDLIASNHTSVTCLTKSLKTTNKRVLKGKDLLVLLRMSDGHQIDGPETFLYKEDPTIDTIEPMKTFLSGGVILTVSGGHLDSVALPWMDVFMLVDTQVHTSFESACEVVEADQMKCPTPEIIVPPGLERRRRRRDTRPISGGSLDSTNGGHSAAKDDSLSRTARAAEEDGQLNDRLKFYLGFRLDGVTLYKNISESPAAGGGILNVYRNPEFDNFKEDGYVKIYRPYWPFKDSHIVIIGRHLDYAATQDHYVITVGVNTCDDVDLTTNNLACAPPERQPDANKKEGSYSPGGAPQVTVTVGNIKAAIGYLKYEHTFWENAAFKYGIIGGVSLFLLLLLLFFLIRIMCCRQAKQNKHPNLELQPGKLTNTYISAYYSTPDVAGSHTSYLNPTMELLDLLPEDLRLKVEDCLIDYKRMQLGKMVGQGHFGRVYVGQLTDTNYTNDQTVAIKTLREYHVTPKDVGQFLEEATIMKDVQHEHILPLIGVVIENNRAYVLLPYMENGDLKTFISNEDNMLTVGELINFGLQISYGMQYLSEQKFIHRDLASRNCMVNKELIVKIADFGLSRDIYENDYYQESNNKRPLPVKWMATESLEKGMFTTKSDVWSFGVLLWELMTRGCTPYPDVDALDVKTYLRHGNRMDKPDYAPEDMYTLMMWCWDTEPQLRPTFSQVAIRLHEILEGQNAATMLRKKRAQQLNHNTRVGGHNYLDLFV